MGKGTYSRAIAKALGVPHISTGDILRREVAAGTKLGKAVKEYMERGLLVPDSIINLVVEKRLSQPDCAKGFVLDGYPRTLSQARFLESRFPVDVAVLLEAPDDVIVERVSGRLVCPRCGATYHVKWKPPKVPGVCDVCGARLVRRRDDDPEVVRERLRLYRETIRPVVDYYRGLGKLLEFDASIDSREGIPLLLEKLKAFRAARPYAQAVHV